MAHTSIQDLENEIERLVRQYMDACEIAAAAAVQRAFAGARASRPAVAKGSPRAKTRATAKRRSSEELAALGEQLYSAVCSKPGETMSVLATEIGASARELHKPMALLKSEGKVRSAGQRNHTRYFPMAAAGSLT
jgi:hypothetical protein